jgi:hypothetical protein
VLSRPRGFWRKESERERRRWNAKNFLGLQKMQYSRVGSDLQAAQNV